MDTETPRLDMTNRMYNEQKEFLLTTESININ